MDKEQYISMIPRAVVRPEDCPHCTDVVEVMVNGVDIMWRGVTAYDVDAGTITVLKPVAETITGMAAVKFKHAITSPVIGPRDVDTIRYYVLTREGVCEVAA